MRLVTLLLVALSLNGCASVVMTLGPPETQIYAGTRFDARVIGSGGLCEKGNCPFMTEVAPFVIDLPFSFVMDTVFLPYTVPSAIINSGKSEKQNEAGGIK